MIHVDDQPIPWHPELTIARLLEQMPEAARFCAVVRLNGKLVSSPAFASTPVPDQSTIRLLPLVAGG